MKKGFTIIELMVVIFIFSIVMVVASSAFSTSFLAGRTHSTGSEEANRSLSLILDVIGQKMNNTGSNGTINGFHVDNTGLLTIVLPDNTTCVYFKNDAAAIKMAQSTCAAPMPLIATFETISSPNLKITNFDLSTKNEYSSASKTPPYLIVKIAAKDSASTANASLETAYNIPAYTYNKW